MVPSSLNQNRKEAITTTFIIAIFFFFFFFFFILLSTTSAANYNNTSTMKKVHPVPRKRNSTLQFDSDHHHLDKKLRRLPHVFSRVLELPFPSDADVGIIEEADCFRFIAETEGMGDVRAHTVEVHPDVIKIVVRVGDDVQLSLDQLEIDTWRFRLPESTQPELARATFVDGKLVVMVPKRYVDVVEVDNDGDVDADLGDFDRFLIVQ